MRLIDADALLAELDNTRFPGAPYVDAGISVAIGKVCEAPTVEPERKTGRWIPCNERLPKKSGKYIVSGRWGSGKEAVGECEYSTNDGYFNASWNFDVLAWMGMPKPYKEEQDEHID